MKSAAVVVVAASVDEDTETTNPRMVVAVILGGGAGTRLFPLTKRRAKPTVPIGGAYRLIDVPMSNCINIGINKVYALTQFNSASLNRHLSRAYDFSNGVGFGDGFVEVLAATQRPGSEGKRWFQGTADAVRQFAWLFDDAKSKDIEDVLILSGDHLYQMNNFVFNVSRASDFGLMKIDDTGRVISFSEKPRGADLKAMQLDTMATLLGLTKEEAEKKPYIASMGAYIFKKEILLNLLSEASKTAQLETEK
ncbi:large subunit of ADP-glucose pyrophosphorylase [Hordeum vulgare]|nr:large subunit of ADP-glucose pyrophosphorylase [Hordeum vulgare]